MKNFAILVFCSALSVTTAAKGGTIFLLDDSTTAGIALQGDGAGDTAALTVDGLNMTLTTRSVISGGVESSISVLVHAMGPADGTFDAGESWTFDWDQPVAFTQIELLGLQGSETTLIQSDDWIGLSFTPGSSFASFNSTTGTFTLFNGEGADDFSLVNLTGQTDESLLSVSAGTDIVISHDGSGANNWGVHEFSWAAVSAPATVVPEPGSWVLMLTGLGSIGWYRRRKLFNRDGYK